MFIVNNKHTKLTINTPRSYRRRCGVFPSKFLVLQDVFSVTIFRLSRPFEDVLRRLQDLFAIRLPKTPSRRLHKTSSRRFSRCLQDAFKMSSRRLQDVFARRLLQEVFKTSSRRLQVDVLQLCLENVLKGKKCYTDVLQKRLQDVFITSSPRQMFAGFVVNYVHISHLSLMFLWLNLNR